MIDQLPPHDVAAERCTIASMILCGDDRVTFSRIRRQLWPGAFFADVDGMGTIYRTLCKLADSDSTIDLVTLIAALREKGVLDDVGGRAFLVDLVNAVPDFRHGPHYAKIVAKMARKREAIRVTDKLKTMLMDPHGEDGDELIQNAIKELWQASAEGRDLNIWSLGEAMIRFVEARTSGDSSVALDAGIRELDREYRGVFTLGGYTLIAARPSMGKSTAIRWVLKGLAEAGTPVGLIAVEENESKIAGNVISAHTSIENSHVAYGRWDAQDEAKIGQAIVELGRVPFYGIDCALTMPDVMAAAELLVMQHGCKVVAIDHIHLIDNGKSRAENRNQQLTEISAALKSFFKRAGVAGIVAAQLNRPERGAVPPPPHLTDLRDSGSLEEHADAVLMVHRKDYYMRGREQYTPDGLCEWFIRKNRNGCVGQIVLKANLEHQRFEEREPDMPFGGAASYASGSDYDAFAND